MILFRTFGAYVVGAALFATLALWHPHSPAYEHYTYLANALLHGRTWIDWPAPGIDAVSYDGEHYIVQGPVPGLLLLPAAIFLEAATNQRLHCAVLAAIGGGAMWQLLWQLGARGVQRVLVFLFFLIGTSFFWCAMYADGPLFAEVAAVTFTTLALLELTGRKRPEIVALFGVLAAGSRYPLISALPIYLVYLLAQAPLQKRGRIALRFEGPVLVGAVLWVGYNLARWGVGADIGPALAFQADAMPVRPNDRAFDIDYLSRQLSTFFSAGPTRLPVFPFLEPTISGMALTYTSPALVFALLARRPPQLVTAMWVCAILVALPTFFYYTNGGDQFGMMHALDFEPFLIVLMALAPVKWMPRLLFVYSCLVGIWGIAYWRSILRS
jgi:hypothetical protein